MVDSDLISRFYWRILYFYSSGFIVERWNYTHLMAEINFELLRESKELLIKCIMYYVFYASVLLTIYYKLVNIHIVFVIIVLCINN